VGSFTRRRGWFVVAQVAVWAGFAAVLLFADPSPDLPGAVALGSRVAGGVLVVAGTALVFAGWGALGPAVSPYPAPRTGTDLVEHGGYRVVRHPIYGGICLGAAGVALLALDPAALAVAVLVIVPFLWLKSSFEERHLVAAYPGYEDYRRRVRKRLIPGLL
jgi:protein-S-isoprenylcysteine O-methyltransferase Ste14